MRVSIVNCVSTAERMMRFSDESLFRNVGHDDFDYVVVTWLPSQEVIDYLQELPQLINDYGCPRARLHVVPHITDSYVGYVPNLRKMMNEGFNFGFLLNDYAGLVNTDCYFGSGWLRGLVKYATPSRVINSLHITAALPPCPVRCIVTENLGVPEPDTFNLQRFQELYDSIYQDNVITSEEIDRGGYRQCASMPYLFHRRWWNECGPWELELTHGTPDVRFFDRINQAGAEFALTESSIVYHHEAVERRRQRPTGTESLSEE